MTRYTPSFPLRDSMIDTLPGESLIVASDYHLKRLQRDAGSQLTGASLLSLSAEAPLPSDALRKARLLVLEVDAASDTSMHRMARIRDDHPELPIIAALEKADVALVRTLIRQGVVDVAELPFVPAQLREQMLDALSSKAGLPESGDLGQAIAVIGSTGGSGATSVLTHLAAAIANRSVGSRGVCLIDLDLQKGTAASYLGVEPAVTMQALLQAGSRLDPDLMMSAVTDSGRGFWFIAAPETIEPIDKLDIDHLLAILSLARSAFDYVLVDLPPVWTDWSLSMVNWAGSIVVLTDPWIASIRQAKRTIDLLSSVGVPGNRTLLAVNRLERRLFGAADVKHIARALGQHSIQTVADAGSSLRAAQDQGLLLPAVQSKSRFAADITTLADRLISGDLT